MKKEVEFVKSMTEKLRTQGDITVDEAAHIFVLATVIYTYEAGHVFERRYRKIFGDKFDYTEMSAALDEWYKEVFSRIPDYRPMNKYRNFVASIPSRFLCPLIKMKVDNKLYTKMTKTRNQKPNKKERSLKSLFSTTDYFYFDEVKANKEMQKWLKNNVPLSFDAIIYNERTVLAARFGVLGLLPTIKKTIKKEKIETLWKLHVPFLRSDKTKDEFYSVIYPAEYRDIVDAVVNDLPLPPMPRESSRTSRDIEYINSLAERLPYQDITLEEADNLYLLFKMYQALMVAALDGNGYFRDSIQEAVEPGLNALRLWYETVEGELKKGRRGNFVYTLPSDLSMNLYQLRKPVENCLKMLPKEPPEIAVRDKEDLPVKDVFLDTSCMPIITEHAIGTNRFDMKSFRYQSSRYGFFERNGINLKEWKPVLRCHGYMGNTVLNLFYGDPVLGKLRFAEHLGIKYIVVENVVAVKEKDRERMLEILNLPNDKIMLAAEIAAQKDPKTAQDNKNTWGELMRTKNPSLEHVIQGVEMVYKAQKDQKEYIDDGSWMEIDR